VHVNGFVTLGSPPYPPYRAYNPRLYMKSNPYPYSVIAPFWTDIDLRGTDGVVYLGYFWRYPKNRYLTWREAKVFRAVDRLVGDWEGDWDFLPTEVTTVTWVDVSPFPGTWYPTLVSTCAFDM